MQSAVWSARDRRGDPRHARRVARRRAEPASAGSTCLRRRNLSELAVGAGRTGIDSGGIESRPRRPELADSARPRASTSRMPASRRVVVHRRSHPITRPRELARTLASGLAGATGRLTADHGTVHIGGRRSGRSGRRSRLRTSSARLRSAPVEHVSSRRSRASRQAPPDLGTLSRSGERRADELRAAAAACTVDGRSWSSAAILEPSARTEPERPDEDAPLAGEPDDASATPPDAVAPSVRVIRFLPCIFAR